MNVFLTGKRALVTGAGRGIGRQLVKQLLACEAQVVALSKTKANLDSLCQECPSIDTVCCDLEDWKETRQKVSQLGRIDLLVNNASISEGIPFGQINEETINRHFNTNVKSVINITQIIAEGMKANGGSIVNVSSVAALIAIDNHLVYGASKAALDQMTRNLASELGHYNIRVNSVNPSIVWTERAINKWSDERKRRVLTAKTPLERFSETEDVANAIIYLLSDKARTITGTCIPIDGGLLAR